MRSIARVAFVHTILVAAGALAAVVDAKAAGDKGAYEYALTAAKTTYEASRARCDALKGNAKGICVAEANEARTKTEARARATYEDTPKARARSLDDIAEAHYKVVRARCDDRSGNDKDVCIKVAKAELTRAKANAKAGRESAEARDDAARKGREADYEVAVQKCQALSGDAKSDCLKDAKTRYGK